MSFFNRLKSDQFTTAFLDNVNSQNAKNLEQTISNSKGVSQSEIDAYVSAIHSGAYTYGYSGNFAIEDFTFVNFSPLLENKKERIQLYREMHLYPEINDATDNVENDAIMADKDGRIVTLNIRDTEDLKVPVNLRKRISKTFDRIVYDVLNFNENANDWFRKWLIEAELFLEMILDSTKSKIIGVQVLPAYTMVPLYEKTGTLYGFAQMVIDLPYAKYGEFNSCVDGIQTFAPNQVIYVNYGRYGENKMDVRGYYESAIRVYNQLKNIEDAIVLYRLVRAPERRVWNIFTGRMSKGKAEEYVKGLMRRYRKKNLYDPATGNINSALNIQTAIEDYWFSKDADGNGTTVDTVGGGINLGEIEDLNFFLSKLYKALRLPSSRWQDPSQSQYTGGKMGEISREEVRFGKWINSIIRRFKYVILVPLIEQLRFDGVEEQYLNSQILNIEFTRSSYFQEYLELDMLTTRLDMVTKAWERVYNADTNPTGTLAAEFVWKEFFKMSEDKYMLNESLLDVAKKKADVAAQLTSTNNDETKTTTDDASSADEINNDDESYNSDNEE